MKHEHKTLVLIILGIVFAVVSIVGFFYTLFITGDWRSYPSIAIFASISFLLLRSAIHPPVRLDELGPQNS